MKKKLLFLLSAVLLTGLTACKDTPATSSGNATSGSTQPSVSVQPSPSVVESPSEVATFTEEELAEAREYLNTNKKSVCAVAEGDLWKSYCSGGEQTIEILHAYYNQKTNSGDIAVLDGTGTVGAAIALSESDAFPTEEATTIFTDFVYNACTIDRNRTVDEQRALDRICNKNIKVDEANIWNYRVSVDENGKVYGMFPSSNQSGAGLPEPYFSAHASTKANMSNEYLFWDSVSEDRAKVHGTVDNHIFQVAIPNGGFNIVESTYHAVGRWNTYKFNPSTDYDLISWAFLGSDLGVGTLTKADKIRDGFGVIDNPEDVYYLASAGQNVQLAKVLVPGQLDGVSISYEAREENEYRITTTFSYDPYDTYQKILAFETYLNTEYAALDEETLLEVEDLHDAIEPLRENAELAIVYLNTETVRTGDAETIVRYTEEAGESINLYKEAVINLRFAMFELAQMQ